MSYKCYGVVVKGLNTTHRQFIIARNYGHHISSHIHGRQCAVRRNETLRRRVVRRVLGGNPVTGQTKHVYLLQIETINKPRQKQHMIIVCGRFILHHLQCHLSNVTGGRLE
jgi:hypothetical protein